MEGERVPRKVSPVEKVLPGIVVRPVLGLTVLTLVEVRIETSAIKTKIRQIEM
jgi:hypothetical protein